MRSEGFQVCDAECAECLFSPNRIVSASRMREILRDCQEQDTHFICHKSTLQGGNVACRGWFDRYSSNLSRIAERLGAVRFVEVNRADPS